MIKDKNIIALDFAGKKLKKLPASIGALSNLEHLNLWDNNLIKLPNTIESLLNLQYLYLDWNKFENLPNIQWDKLKSLKKLSYTNNSKVIEFPQSLFRLIKKNFIQKYIDEGVIFNEAPVLGLLEVLTGMKLKKLIKKEKISRLYACDYKINLNGNIIGIYLYGYHSFQINIVPEYLSSLKFLEELTLRDQNIEHIPEFIKNITTLKHLDLRRNNIEIIPESILELKLLEFLDIGENKIKEIPKSIRCSNIDLWL
ncbi:MAG: leucine-rich repeat domain-containing protein [Candidatus Hodarchaeota archaeon]